MQSRSNRSQYSFNLNSFSSLSFHKFVWKRFQGIRREYFCIGFIEATRINFFSVEVFVRLFCKIQTQWMNGWFHLNNRFLTGFFFLSNFTSLYILNWKRCVLVCVRLVCNCVPFHEVCVFVNVFLGVRWKCARRNVTAAVIAFVVLTISKSFSQLYDTDMTLTSFNSPSFGNDT